MKMKNEKTRRQPGLSLNKFRVWIVLVGGIILGCAMTLSYNHTVNLFKYAGYVVWLSHIGTVMIELTFFLGTSVIILSRSVGMAAGWPARATFIFGAGLVLWSNVSSGIMLLDEQWTAVVLGVAVVTCLFLMEAVVSRALFMFRDEQEPEVFEQEPAVFERKPEEIEQEPEVSEQNPKVFEQEPAVFEQKPEEIEQEPEVSEQNPKVFEQEPAVFEQKPEEIEQEPEVSEQNPKVFEQEPEVSEEKPEEIEQEPEVFKRKPWMKPLFERIGQIVKQEKELPTIRGLAEETGVTPYKAGEALKMWKA